MAVGSGAGGEDEGKDKEEEEGSCTSMDNEKDLVEEARACIKGGKEEEDADSGIGEEDEDIEEAKEGLTIHTISLLPPFVFFCLFFFPITTRDEISNLFQQKGTKQKEAVSTSKREFYFWRVLTFLVRKPHFYCWIFLI